MAFVSVTRLRLRSVRFLPPFAWHTLASRRQLRRSSGFLGGSLLADRRLTFWTMTRWNDQAAMRGYMLTGAHRRAMPRLAGWCDEASVVHWRDDGSALPDWPVAIERMRHEGRPSRVDRPSVGHEALAFSQPRLSGVLPIADRRARLWR